MSFELKMQNFKKLLVWQKAFQFVDICYEHTAKSPPNEKYILTSQLKRAAISITNNIAEGCGRYTPNDLAHFLQMALSSTTEVENALLIAQSLGYLQTESFAMLNSTNTEIRRMLSLIEKNLKGN